MEPDFIHRANIRRFEQLLASGTLDPAQAAVTRGLLENEVEALARLTKRPPTATGSAPPSQ